METQKLDWSKLSELPPYAPTGPGRYVMRCGGVVEVEFVGSVWRVIGYAMIYWNVSGSFCYQENHPFDIVAPAPDVLPWEECERLKDEINHWKVKAECYGEMVHGCHPVFVRLGVLDENNSGVGAIANAAQKLATINDQLKAERDEWKQAANTLASDIKRLSVRAEMPQDAEIKEGRWQSVERELCDLQQRVAKLEQFHEAIVKPGTGFTVVTLPQEIEPLPAVTDRVEPVFKVGDVVTLHPAYKPEHGDMAGWRYLEEGEEIKDGDEFLDARNKWHLTYDTRNRQGNPVSFPRRRRVQAEMEVAQ